MGRRMGVVASPDHTGFGAWPASTPASRDQKDIFAALHARRTFGVSNAAARLTLDFRGDGSLMGQEYTLHGGDCPVLYGEAKTDYVHPTSKVPGVINTIKIFRVREGNTAPGESGHIYSLAPKQANTSFVFFDANCPKTGTAAYYMRVQQSDVYGVDSPHRPSLGWTSPVFVTWANGAASRRALVDPPSLPAQIVEGSSHPLTIEVHNSGDIPWTGLEEYQLAIDTDGPSVSTISTLGKDDFVLAGSSHTFTATVNADVPPGAYKLTFQMDSPAGHFDAAITTDVEVISSALCGDGEIGAGETCDPPASCPSACNDGVVCTDDTLTGSASTCDAVCNYLTIAQCKNNDACCPPGCDSVTDNDCSSQCGDEIIDAGETCDPPSSCPDGCSDGIACTVDTLTGSAENCNVACSYTPITSCRNGDDCCAPGCNINTDDDCSPRCGDGVIGAGETCDPPASCPGDCDDGVACTADTLTGSAANCSASCSNTPIMQCKSGDGCCAVGCTWESDDDCSKTCGNGTVEAGESCDPPSSCPTDCEDDDACTRDLLTGGAASCSAACSHTKITACNSGDGCCPAGCAESADEDCQAETKTPAGREGPRSSIKLDGGCTSAPTTARGGELIQLLMFFSLFLIHRSRRSKR